MPDWRKSMQQTYEYCRVDTNTWKDMGKIDAVKNCNIDRDSGDSTLGHATIDSTEDLGECYIRAYMITIQNGIREKHPLGTYIVQTPSESFDGKVHTRSLDAYTPLLELKDTSPPLGYTVMKNQKTMEIAGKLCMENMRAPVVVATDTEHKVYDDFVANTDDSWLSFISDLMAYAKYGFDMDEMGQVLFAPKQDVASLQPVWTYDDDNSSILYPDIDVDRDLYGIPNVVEVIYSTENGYLYSRAVNDDKDSPISTVNRGREVLHRDASPSISGIPDQNMIDEYAKQLLRDLSCLEYTITYKHGYCPVRVGDCVWLNYRRAGIIDTKAKVISQSFKCEPGCQVTETAVYTNKLWG